MGSGSSAVSVTEEKQPGKSTDGVDSQECDEPVVVEDAQLKADTLAQYDPTFLNQLHKTATATATDAAPQLDYLDHVPSYEENHPVDDQYASSNYVHPQVHEFAEVLSNAGVELGGRPAPYTTLSGGNCKPVIPSLGSIPHCDSLPSDWDQNSHRAYALQQGNSLSRPSSFFLQYMNENNKKPASRTSSFGVPSGNGQDRDSSTRSDLRGDLMSLGTFVTTVEEIDEVKSFGNI